MTELWEHQKKCVELFEEHNAHLFGLPMGGGKTLASIATADKIDAKSILILCPKAVVNVWPNQFDIHVPNKYRILPLSDNRSVAKKAESLKSFIKFCKTNNFRYAIIINYDSAWRPGLGPKMRDSLIIEKGAILSEEWDLLILDESHRTKTPGSKISRFVTKLGKNTKSKILLSGTPMPHGPLDIFAQARIINPNIFGSNYHLFKMRYAILGGWENKQIIGYQNMDDFHSKLRTFMFSVRKEDIPKDLPEESHQVIDVDMPKDVMNLYRTLAQEFVADVESGRIVASNAGAKIIKMQQIINGFAIKEDGFTERFDTTKIDTMIDFIADIDKDEKLVIFYRFKEDVKAIVPAIENIGRSCAELSGSKNQLKDWQDGKYNTIACQIQSGSLGVDLTMSRYTSFYSLDYNYGSYSQALARTHRPGQKRAVTHYYLIAKGTVDQRILNNLLQKDDDIKSILDAVRNNDPCF